MKSDAFSQSSEMSVAICTYPDFLLMLFGLKFVEPSLPSVAISRHDFSVSD